jgi:hypothetical protein
MLQTLATVAKIIRLDRITAWIKVIPISAVGTRDPPPLKLGLIP